MDRIDQKIMQALAANGRLPIAELSRQIGLSKTACQMRLKRLQDERYIIGFRAILNPNKLDREHVSFTEVRLSDTSEKALTAFNQAVLSVIEVEQCHMIAGSFDYLLKVRTRDISDYRRVLGEEISKLPHVAHTSTFVSMEAVKDQSSSNFVQVSPGT